MSKHDFVYVTEREASPIKNELYAILHEAQDLVRKHFTFDIKPVGSAKRNMITRDLKSNIGFDFDFNIEPNDGDENYTAEEIRNIIRNAIDRVAPKYGYTHCEDSTRVLTIKKVNTFMSRIEHSCDFAIVYNTNDGRQQYIRFNKKTLNYTWEYQGKGFENLHQREDWIKKNNRWNELKDYYLYKKDNNDNPDKHSRSIYAESVNEICQKYGYKK